MDQQKFFNYYTELLNKNVQELFNKLLILQTNEKLHIEELNSLRKQLEDLKNVKTEEQEIIELRKENSRLLSIENNANVYKEQLQKAQEKIKELEKTNV